MAALRHVVHAVQGIARVSPQGGTCRVCHTVVQDVQLCVSRSSQTRDTSAFPNRIGHLNARRELPCDIYGYSLLRSRAGYVKGPCKCPYQDDIPLHGLGGLFE